MKKRILLLATVAALMAVMFLAMASAAFAVPPAGGGTGCLGGTNNASHAADQSSPSEFAQDNVDSPARNNEAAGTQNNTGLDKAHENLRDGARCRN
jgi:hypothetical protein